MNFTKMVAMKSTVNSITSTSQRRAVTRRRVITTPRSTKRSMVRRGSMRKAAIITSIRATKKTKVTIIITITTRNTARRKGTSTEKNGTSKRVTTVTNIIAELRYANCNGNGNFMTIPIVTTLMILSITVFFRLILCVGIIVDIDHFNPDVVRYALDGTVSA